MLVRPAAGPGPLVLLAVAPVAVLLPPLMLVLAWLATTGAAAFAPASSSASFSSASPFSFTSTSPSTWGIQWTSPETGATTTYLRSGSDIYFYWNGAKYSALEGTLQHVSTTDLGSLTDAVGQYNYTQTVWQAQSSAITSGGGSGGPRFATNVRLYWNLFAWSSAHSGMSVDVARLQAVVFEQVYLDGADNTGTGDVQAVISSFPSLLVNESTLASAPVEKGYFQWSGPFTWGTDSTGPWMSGASIVGGIRGGPIVLFDKSTTYCAMVAPFSQFMATSLYYTPEQGEVQIGFMGNASSIPAGYMTETMILFGQQGVVDTVLGWGNVLRARYGKDHAVTYSDMAIEYLGYNTDNGAYYYYNTEPSQDYQTTMHDVRSYLESINVPIRYIWLDSWWYFKDGKHGGVLNWTAMPSVFPDGLATLHETLAIPFIAHNRFWSSLTSYAKQNGGSYDFLLQGTFAAPLEQRFWDDLLGTAAAWGLRTYEQDWLYNEFEGLPAFSYDVKLGRAWLMQMGQGAQKNGLTIQYCMSLPRHVLQSVEIPAVTSMRASDDYLSGEGHDQWRIGDTSIFAHAVGIAPFKDNFWTTSKQPGNPYNTSEPSPELQTAVVTLSCAQVTIGDGIGYVNTTLLSRAIREDGLVLKPDRPAMSLDRTFLARAFGDDTNGLEGNVTYTYTQFGEWRWHMFLVADLVTSGAVLRAADTLPYDSSAQTYAAFAYTPQAGLPAKPTLSLFDASNPIPLQACGRTDFQLVYAAPVFANGVVLLGDLSKWVPMSRQRVQSWSIQADGAVSVRLLGVPGEVVNFSFALVSSQSSFAAMVVSCAIDVDTKATLTIVVDGSAQCSSAVQSEAATEAEKESSVAAQ